MGSYYIIVSPPLDSMIDCQNKTIWEQILFLYEYKIDFTLDLALAKKMKELKHLIIFHTQILILFPHPLLPFSIYIYIYIIKKII